MRSNASTRNAARCGYDSSPRSCWSGEGSRPCRLGRRFAKHPWPMLLGCPGAGVSLPGRPPSLPGSSPMSNAAALSCRPSWSSASASWPSPRRGLDDRRRGGRRCVAPVARTMAAVPPAAAAAAAAPGPVPWPADRLGVGWARPHEARHPHDPSHWYLFILGTEPAAQGRGLGSALLARVLARVDAERMPVYWSRRASGTSPCTAATASRSPVRSRFRAARGSGPCGASPELERVITEGSVRRGQQRSRCHQ